MQDPIDELLRSEKFLRWRKPKPKAHSPGRGKTYNYTGRKYTNLVTNERYFAPSELAEIWGVSVQTIRDLFREEEGVLKFGSNGTRTKRARKTLRIPESVADRVHARLSS